MKTLKKPLSLLMALFMCLGMFAGTGVTAFAAGETMTTYMVDIPRANDPNKAGWGHPALNFLGGWSTSAGTHFSVHTQDAYNGRAIYCIEPGIGVHSGDQYTGRGEDFWDNYPSSLNPTIPPNTIKEYIGRIMTYGWQGNASTSWMSSNPDHANQMAGYIATQLLVWETIVGERDSQFNHVDANAQGKNNVTEYIGAEHPLRSQIFSQYSAIESAVKRHTMLPSFFSSTADAGAYELKWDGEKYSTTLTDTNGVLGDYTFTSSTAGLNFSVDGSQLTITSSQALKSSVTVKAEKISAQRSGVVVWTDGVTGGGTQDFATALANSCNGAFATLATQVGGKTLEKYAKEAGLTSKVNVNGLNTAAGSFTAGTSDNDVGWSGVGQYKDLVNPCAELTLMGCIAQGGSAATPRLLKSVTSSKGLPVAHVTTETSKIGWKADTCDKIRTLMHNNVTSNYSKNLDFGGLNVCAKSGTAEVGTSKPHAWFVGFVEDSAYPYAFVVVVENGGWGSSVAGGVAASLLKAACQ